MHSLSLLPPLSLSLPSKGDMINNIEYNVEHAAAYVEKGQQNVRIARDYKRKNNRVSKHNT